MTAPTPATAGAADARAAGVAAAARYCGFAAFLDRLAPDSPLGRDAKAAFGFTADRTALEAAWDDTEVALSLLTDTDASAEARLRRHLARLTRPPRDADALEEADLFAVKRLLHHYSALLPLLGDRACAAFGLAWSSADLLALLGVGRQPPETFFLADDYAPALASVRAELREADALLARLDEERLASIAAAYGLDLTGREFAVVATDALPADPTAGGVPLLAIEPYDAAHVLIRPLPDARRLASAAHREGMADDERAAEAGVLADLSARVAAELPTIRRYAAAAARLDLALARARLARECDLVRPALGRRTRLVGGRLPSIEALCAQIDARYTPLDLDLDERPMVLSGANMGGKTVVLQTIVFAQLAAQHGLFVPAEAYETSPLAEVVVVAEGGADDASRGLSGFGREIVQLRAALAADGPALLVFDEFARSTSADEAAALLGAVTARLAAREGVRAVFATHARGLGAPPGVRFLRMRGLRDAALRDLGTDPLSPGAPLSEAIARINRHMDYRVEQEGCARSSDALTIAAALGLDTDLVRDAEERLARAHRPPGRGAG